MNRIRLLLMFFVFASYVSGCVESRNAPKIDKFPVKTTIIYDSPDNIFELVITGKKVGDNLFPEIVSIKKKCGIDSVTYKPADQDSLENSAYDFTYSWSPNGKKIALPKGRFEGFDVYSTENLIENIRYRNKELSICIKDNAGAMMWHDFLGWQKDDTIVFSAGLSGKTFVFIWNVETGNLKSLDLEKGQYDVEK